MLPGGGFEIKLQKFFERTQTAWNNCIKPGLQIATHLISGAVVAKTENPQMAQKMI